MHDKLYIDFYKTNLSNEDFELFTYTNPDYFQKMNLGLSVHNVPKVIKTYEFDPGMGLLKLMRGEYTKLMMIDPTIRFEEQFTAHPVAPLSYINNDFAFDAFQHEAVEVVKQKRQGVIHAVTSAGKSLMIIKAICELGQRALIVVHRKILMQQFIEDIEKYVRDEKGNTITIGIIGAGKNTVGDITIAIDKTLAKHIAEYEDTFGVVFMDECHLAPCTTMLSVINRLKCERRYGFSGTLKRKDQKEFLIFSTFGPVIYTIKREHLLELGRVVPVNIEIVRSKALFDYEGTAEALGITRAHQIMQGALATDPGRRQLILDLVAKLAGKATKTIVLSMLVKPCYDLSGRLTKEYGIENGVITGRDAKEALESYNQMKHKDLKVIFATVGCMSTGVSISDLDNIVLIAPIFTNELLLHQIRGRLFRTAPGKTHGTLYFIYDEEVFTDYKLNKFLAIMAK